MSVVCTAPVTARRLAVPANDPAAAVAGSVPSSLGRIFVRAGDTLDVGIDWRAWGQANRGRITASTWIGHASSPNSPTLTNLTMVDETRQHAVVMLDASEAAVGAVYWLVNTITMTDPGYGAFTVPERTVERMIVVEVTR